MKPKSTKDDIFQTARQRDFYLKMLKIKEKENTELKEDKNKLQNEITELLLKINKIKARDK
jgi:ribosomal protein S21